MDMASGNLDFHSVCMLMEHAERLLESLGQLKSIIASQQEGNGNGNGDMINPSNKINDTLHKLALVAEDALELSSRHGSRATSSARPHPQDSSDNPPRCRPGQSPSVATDAVRFASGIFPSDVDDRVEIVEELGVQVVVVSGSPDTRQSALGVDSESMGHQAVTSAATSEEPRIRKQLPLSRRIDGTESDRYSAGKKRSAEENNPLDHGKKMPKIRPNSSTATQSSQGQDTTTLEVDRLTRKLRYNDKLCRVSALNCAIGTGASIGMIRRAAAVQGGPAIRQFCSLIYERRSREYETGLLHLKSQGLERALELSSSLGALTRKTLYGAFLIRLIQFHMAEAVDETKNGRLRTDPSQIREAMERFGWKPADKAKFFQYLRQGRQWRSICGQMRGLLCLIPLRSEKPYLVSPKDYLAMKGEDVDQFTSIIMSSSSSSSGGGGGGFLQRLNSACEVFQSIVTGAAEDRTFRWEREHPQLRDWGGSMDENILATLLEPDPTCGESFIVPGDLEKWPRPPGWREEWPWPANPLAIVPSERQCDFCETSGCLCASERFRPSWLPRIKWYGRQGVGLQAVAGLEGDLAYVKGDLIGKLCGRLMPAGTYAANSLWVVDMHRLDVDVPAAGASAVCQIYVGGAASAFCNLNHSCRASVRMRPARASGRWVMAIEAVRDIRHGEQLTVSFGKRFLRDQGLRCECEVCSGPATSREGSG